MFGFADSREDQNSCRSEPPLATLLAGEVSQPRPSSRILLPTAENLNCNATDASFSIDKKNRCHKIGCIFLLRLLTLANAVTN